jgi:hypothetical protein
MGMVEGNVPVSDNEWETVTKGGDAAIKKWIADQMTGKSCTIVLVGAETSTRKWVRYEIVESWNAGKGVLGVRIHNLKDLSSNQSMPGPNPFDAMTLGSKKLSSYVTLYDPPYSDSKHAYDYIKQNLADWVEAAVKARAGV